MTVLCSYLLSMDEDFFAIRERHLCVPEDRQTCARHFAKFGYRPDAPLTRRAEEVWC